MAIHYKAEPTASKFHRSDAFVRGLRGPIGTGKSVTCCMEMVRRAREQAPFEGVRRSRWAAIRNTYPELKSTTIKTWQDWSDAPVKWDSPITSMFTRKLGDGTMVEMEVLFMSLDRPDDVKKLKSLDLTGVWLNEASELAKAVLDMATGRVGRFPSKVQGGATWSGVILDTNSPDDDHWYYELAERPTAEEIAQREDLVRQLVGMGLMREGQLLYEWFAQPGALIKVGDRYEPNPEAENVANHTLGYGYWLRQIAGKNEEWIKVFVLGQYGSVHDGKPVYPEWNDTLHCKAISPLQGVPLDIGLDFGLTPAAVITQVDSRGRLLVLDEMCGEDMAVRQFLQDVLIPQLVKVYPQWWAKRNADEPMVRCFGDPAGQQKSQADEKTCFQEVRAAGLRINPGKTNGFLARRSAVAWFLSKLSGGQPTLLLDPCCGVLRKGFNGGYKYRRIQVTGEERYTEEPSKNKYSHCFVAGTSVSTPGGETAIERLRVGDLVNTPAGQRTVLATMSRETALTVKLEFSDGVRLECTPDHPFIAPDGRRLRADELQYNDVLQSIGQDQWRNQEKGNRVTSVALRFISRQVATTSRTLSRMGAGICTVLFGRQLTGQSLRDVISITGMATRATMTLETWNALTRASMYDATQRSGFQEDQRRPRSTWKVSGQPHRLGTDRMQAEPGTASTGRNRGLSERLSNWLAFIAALTSRRLSALQSAVFAPRHAKLQRAELAALMTNSEGAQYAARPSPSTGMPKREHAVRLVQRHYSAEPKEVFDITVEGAHSFFAAGILVGNCHDALQYVALESGGVQATMPKGPPRRAAPTYRISDSATGVLG